MDGMPRQILDAAAGLFDSQGVAVSTAKVAAAAGVSNGTLFHYFPTKQDLLDALYIDLKEELADALGDLDGTGDVEEQVRTLFHRWVAWSQDNPKRHRVTNLLVRSGLASADALEAVEARFATGNRLFERAQAEGLLVDLPREYVAGVLHAHVDLAVACGLDAQQRDRAFDAMWLGLLAASHVPTSA